MVSGGRRCAAAPQHRRSRLILSALTVHFRDIKDILANVMTLWFFATPIIYYWKFAPPAIRRVSGSESLYAPGDLVSGDPVLPGRFRPLEVAAGARRRLGAAVPVRILSVRSPARLFRGRGLMRNTHHRGRESTQRLSIGSKQNGFRCVLRALCGEIFVVMNAIEVTNVTKVYRRYARRKQFATLKSALLKGSLIQDLQPEETFPALQGVSFNVTAGTDLRDHRPQRLRQEHRAEACRRHYEADDRNRKG